MSPSLDILVCTIDSGIRSVESIFMEEQPGVTYIISHQITDPKFAEIPECLQSRTDVVVSQIAGKGLSKNRNNSLEASTGDIALIADDDVQYLPESFNLVRKIFMDDPSLDVACFKIKTGAGEAEYKKYPEKATAIRSLFHRYISSIEIAFRTGVVKAHKIRFDERFGLGSERIHAAEENVFIEDCIRAGLNVRFIPVYLVSHPQKTSENDPLEFELKRNRVRGAYHGRILGWKAVPVAFADILFHSPSMIRKGRNPFRFLKERLDATWYIYSTNRKNQC